MAPEPLAAISAAGTEWAWYVAAAVGAAVGVAVSASRERKTLGCLGNLFIGVVGALLGELILDKLFDIQLNDILWVALAAFTGASLLVIVIVGAFGHWRTPTETDY